MKRAIVVIAALAILWIGLGEPGRGRVPHKAEWLPAGHLRLRVLRAGKGDSTLLLLHGYGESLLTWRLMVDPLARRYRVVALDLPGFGLSDKPDTVYDVAAYIGWLEDFLDHQTSGPIVVVGHSMGGQLAAQLALARPERVVAAVLVAPAGAGINRVLTDSGGATSTPAQWLAAAMAYMLPVHDPTWLAEPTDRAGYEPAADSMYHVASQRVLDQFDFAAMGQGFRRLRQPVLLIWGKQDPTIPFSIGEQIAAMLPCRRFVSLAATLHRPEETQPDTVVTEVLEFLRSPRCE